MTNSRQPSYRGNIGRDPETRRYHVRKMIRGRTHHRSFRTKKSAQAYLDDLELVAAGVPVGEAIPTLDEACEDYEARLVRLGRSDQTQVYYHKRFRVFRRLLPVQLPINNLTQADIDQFVQARQTEGIGARRINKDLADLRRLYRQAGNHPRWR